MSKILYGVTGVGFGHSSRADAISNMIGDDHVILFAASNKAHDYLASIGKDVVPINGFEYAIKGNEISYIKTFWKNVLNLPLFLHSFFSLVMLVRRFDPDMVITDFEPLTAIVAKLTKRPLVSVDHQNVICRTAIEYPPEHEKGFFLANLVARYMVNAADLYLVTSFFFPKLVKDNIKLIPPIVREMVRENKAFMGDHVIVYYHSGNEGLYEILKTFKDMSFIVYGENIEMEDENISFRKTSKTNFIKDLASAKAVINNGGYTLISESLYFRKPILSIPVSGQFEQVLNAYYLEKMGFGMFLESVEQPKLAEFFGNIDHYMRHLEAIEWDGNEEFLKEFASAIHSLERGREKERYPKTLSAPTLVFRKGINWLFSSRPLQHFTNR